MRVVNVKPFFSEEELETASFVQAKGDPCLECGLFKGCISPKMPVTGQGKRKVLVAAESPGKNEDEQNTQLVGDAGQYLRECLEEFDLDLDRDFYKTNSLRCRPPGNRKPKKKELSCCRHDYFEFIKENKPNFVWLLGKSAVESFYMNRLTSEEGDAYSISRWRGLCIPDYTINAYVIPLFHPSYAIRKEGDLLTQSQYRRDIEFAVKCLHTKKSLPTQFTLEDKVIILTDVEKIKKNLQRLVDSPPEILTFDYETNSLKPFNNGCKLASVSYCYEDDKAYSFPLQHPCFSKKDQQEIELLWKQVLQNDSKKTAHSLKFEDMWSRVILKTEPSCWHWCSMVAAHILDNRKHFTSLKFQAFIRWGIEYYDKEVGPYLKSKTKAGFNRVFEIPLDKLLFYGGVDSLLEYKLFKEQLAETDEIDLEANNFFIDGLLAMSDIQINGINMDREYYDAASKEIEEKQKEIVKGILTSKEAKLFRKVKGRELSLTSDKDLRELFFDILKLSSDKKTDTGMFSVDAETLMHLDCSIAKSLVEFNKLDKIRGTYMGQFLREINDDGRIHPFFDLHTATTYRSSSSQPNAQNTPVRDEEAKAYARKGIMPDKGHCIIDFDYSSLEIRILGCISKDPVLLSYINDPTTDIHRDMAIDIFLLKLEDVSSKIRFYAKNGFVFPEVYGSDYNACAANLWSICTNEDLRTSGDVYILDHLKSKGVRTKDAFILHLKKVEEVFWNKFKGIRNWQSRTIDFYTKKGYIEQVTGFLCSGYLSKNDILNYPVQGPAFHCLLKTIIHLNEWLRETKQSRIIGQIHDSGIISCHPKEKDEVKEKTNYIATQLIREEWPWIITPLVLEWEETEVDESWYFKKEVNGHE